MRMIPSNFFPSLLLYFLPFFCMFYGMNDMYFNDVVVCKVFVLRFFSQINSNAFNEIYHIEPLSWQNEIQNLFDMIVDNVLAIYFSIKIRVLLLLGTLKICVA